MPKHMRPAERDQAVALYAAGATVDSIAEKFDRDRTTICRLIGRRKMRRGRFSTPQKGAVSTPRYVDNLRTCR